MTVLIIYTDITSTHYQCDIFISRQTKICIYSLTKNGFFNNSYLIPDFITFWDDDRGGMVTEFLGFVAWIMWVSTFAK